MRSACVASMTLVMSATAAGAAETVTGDDLRSAVAGKLVHVSTPLGTVPVNFRTDGTMTGRSQGLAAYAFATSDRGRWWINGDKLCQRWEQWFSQATHCFSMRRDGRRLYWTGGGRSGVATIAN